MVVYVFILWAVQSGALCAKPTQSYTLLEVHWVASLIIKLGILRLMYRDKILYTAMSVAARNKILNEFTSVLMGNRYKDVYKKMLVD